jgi:diguanylate cyclase (GGDEF)-like protein
MTSSLTVGALAEPMVMVGFDERADRLAATFLADPGLSSVGIVDRGRVGLITRERFSQAFEQLGSAATVSQAADWETLKLGEASTVIAASSLARARSAARRYDDIVVELADGRWATLSVVHLLDAANAQLAERASRDDLTGLVNRAHFLSLASAACIEVDHDKEFVAVAFVDLDGMKSINDRYGHRTGDTVLARVGQQLREACQPGEVAARLGGDEFAVLARLRMCGSIESAAKEFGQRFVLAIGARDGHHPRFMRPSASVGVAVATGRTDAQKVINFADSAMYRAKRAGGNRVEVSVVSGTQLPDGDVGLANLSVAQALERGELRVFYQPIVRLSDRCVTSVEALVRWEHPELGLIGPARFLETAHRSGLMPELDRWVMERACADLVSLSSMVLVGAPSNINVNISVPTLDTAFDEMIAAVLRRTGLAPQQLRVELPEDADLQAIDAAQIRLERLVETGVELALDDMGAGSTNLRYLSQLSVQAVKIDRSFIAGMLHNPRDYAVVKLLTDLGHGLGLRVTAEGVETADQVAILEELDVPYAQGFYFLEPVPLASLARHLEALAGTHDVDDIKPIHSLSGQPVHDGRGIGGRLPSGRLVGNASGEG